MATEDYYSLLGVDKSASQDEIKKAFRKKAHMYHPDKNQGDKESEEMFKKISDAYSILSDPNEKAYYDRVGHKREGPQHARYNHDQGDMFRDFVNAFHNNHFRQNIYVNADIKMSTRIGLKDAILGGKVSLDFNRNIACDTCLGNAYVPTGSKCDDCGGKGFHENVNRLLGNMVIRTSCNSCGGSGKKMAKCNKCNGAGFSKKKCKVEVSVPAGIRPRSTLSVKHMGHEVYASGQKIIGNAYLIVDYYPTQDGVTLKNGNLNLTINVPVDQVLSEEEVIIDILGCKEVKLKLDYTKVSGYTYNVQEKDNNSFYFVKVLIDLPKNKISKEDREKLINVFREIYGTSDKKIKPVPISPPNT